MRFGIFSNGWRHAEVPADTYDADVHEIVTADRLGFDEAWISEHVGGPTPDVVAVPELLIAKASALTTRIEMGCAVRLLPLYHPVDVAISAAMCDQLLRGRYLFGFGPGIPFTGNMERRGLSREHRHPMVQESIDLILRCWTAEQAFDWQGRFWSGTDIAIAPRPFRLPHPPLALASVTPDMVRLAATRGWRLMISHHDPAKTVGERAEMYAAAARADGGVGDGVLTDGVGRGRITVARSVYVGETTRSARAEFRPDLEVHLAEQRNFNPSVMRPFLREGQPVNELTADDAMSNGMFTVGDPDHVAERLCAFLDETGGFGTLLIVMGKDWGPPEGRDRSLRLFSEEVVPRLREFAAALQVPAPLPAAVPSR